MASDTYGVRGGGAASWQARWGMQLNEQDLLFAVRREPICKRTVVDVAFDMFAKGFTVEEVSEKPDPAWSLEVSNVLDGLNAKANLTRLFLYERLFGWSILALTYVDYGKDASDQSRVRVKSESSCRIQVCSVRFSLQMRMRILRAPVLGCHCFIGFAVMI
jgi:hypothetical protein